MLPKWPGADHCYAYLLQHVSESEHARYLAAREKRKGRPIRRWATDPQSDEIIEALNGGNEEQIKAWVGQLKTERWLKGRT